MKKGLLGFLLALAVAGGAGPGWTDSYKGFERGQALISPQELHQKLQDDSREDPVVLSVSRPSTYRVGHIPRSRNVWRPDFNAPVGNPWPYGGMIEDREDFQAFARNLGIDDDSEVVVYSHKYDATRLWWAFYLYGKKDVRVLDGGYPGWTQAGYAVERVFGAEHPERGNFTAEDPRYGWRAEIGDLWRARQQADWNLLDTRSKAEWTGREVKGDATCGGRVPWAEHLHWSEFKEKVHENADQPTAFKDAEDLREVVEKTGIEPGQHNIFLCQSGVRTTTEIFSLYLLGFNPDKLHNYDGSWLEWSNHYCGEQTNDRYEPRSAVITNPASGSSSGYLSLGADLLP